MTIEAIEFKSGTTSGGAGTYTSTSPAKRISGVVVAVGLTYNDSPPAGTTDIIVRTKGRIGPVRTILSLVNAATSGWFDIAGPVVDAADGTTPSYNATEPITRIGIPVEDDVELFVDDANDGDSVDAVLLVEN